MGIPVMTLLKKPPRTGWLFWGRMVLRKREKKIRWGGIGVKQCKKRVWSGILVLCMILSLLPAQAMAAGDGVPTSVAAVTATAAVESGAAEDITVRTANVFGFTEDDTNLSIPLEGEGLPAGSWRAQILLDGG